MNRVDVVELVVDLDVDVLTWTLPFRFVMVGPRSVLFSFGRVVPTSVLFTSGSDFSFICFWLPP